MTTRIRVSDGGIGVVSAGPAMPLQAGGVILASTTSTLVGATWVATLIVSLGRPRDAFAAFVDVASAIVTDAAWFIPLLFGVVLAILAVLVGQGFTDIDEEQVDVNRRRLAAATWIVAGIAAGVLLIAVLGAIGQRELAPHVWSITVATGLIVGAALWVGTVVFGSAQQQLRVNRHTIADVSRRLARVPKANRSRRPIRKFFATFFAVTAVSTALSLVFLLVVPSGVPLEFWWLQKAALLRLASEVSAGGAVLAFFAAYFRDSMTTPWAGWAAAVVFATLFVAVPAWGFLGTVGWGETQGPVAVLTIAGFILPVISVLALPRTSFRGFTLRGALDAMRASFVAGRLKSAREERSRLDALVR